MLANLHESGVIYSKIYVVVVCDAEYTKACFLTLITHAELDYVYVLFFWGKNAIMLSFTEIWSYRICRMLTVRTWIY